MKRGVIIACATHYQKIEQKEKKNQLNRICYYLLNIYEILFDLIVQCLYLRDRSWEFLRSKIDISIFFICAKLII